MSTTRFDKNPTITIPGNVRRPPTMSLDSVVDFTSKNVYLVIGGGVRSNFSQIRLNGLPFDCPDPRRAYFYTTVGSYHNTYVYFIKECRSHTHSCDMLHGASGTADACRKYTRRVPIFIYVDAFFFFFYKRVSRPGIY